MTPLSEEDNEKIFQEEILPEYTEALNAEGAALLTYVAGQSAAGKSSAIDAERKRIERGYGTPIVLQRDLLRNFFPGYKDQLRQLGAEGYKSSETDTWKWYEKLKDMARERRLPILIESTFRYPEAILKDIEDFSKAGFRIEIVALAVHPEVSKVGTFFRYEQEIELEGQGRFVDLKTQSDAIAGLVKTIAALESNSKIAQITILNRVGKILSQSSPKVEGDKKASNVLRAAHSILKPEEIQGVKRLWSQVFEKLKARKAPDNEYQTAKNAFAAFQNAAKRQTGNDDIGGIK